MSNGYQHIYKILTLVDANGNLIADQDFAAGNNFYLFENRPDKRTRHASLVNINMGLIEVMLPMSHIVLPQMIGVLNHTFDAKYRYAVNEIFCRTPYSLLCPNGC